MAALRKVRTELAFTREAIDRADEFAIDQHDPLVAFADFGEERLDHVRFGPGLVEHFGQRGQVGALLVDAEDRLPAISMQRLHHHRTVAILEVAQIVEMPRDQRRRHEPRVIEHEHLFRCIDHFARIVSHQRGALEPVEQQRSADIAEMERRILPHQHNVDILRQIDPAPFPDGVMVALDPLDRHRRRMRGDPPAGRAVAFIGQAGDIVMPQLVAACLRGQHQRKRTVARDPDAFERVHLDGNAERHALTFRLACPGGAGHGREFRLARSPPAAHRTRKRSSGLPCVGDVAREAARCKQDHVEPDIFAASGIAMRHRFHGGSHARQPVFVDRMIEIGAPAAPLHFDEGDHPASSGDDVDLARRCLDPPVEDLPAFGPEPDRSAGFAVAAAFLGQPARHSERSSSALA